MAVVVLAATLTGGPAAAAQPGTTPSTPSKIAPAAKPVAGSVTLVTGDKVTLSVGADGKQNVTVTGPDGRLADNDVHVDGGDTYVYPRSAGRYLAAKLLDNDLFNVTRLVADGYGDQVPLIVTYTDAAARSRTQQVPAGARQQRTLDSIHGAAMVTDGTAGFWHSLTAGSTTRSQTPALSGGIAKVWLDGKVKADLADSTAQIGAPEVWQGGNTGQGVDVAVLDTGVDLEHPDLDDRVTASASFVPGEDVTDRQGHGTHVASTIAGTGDASGGVERGVAPGARLHVGKVLNNEGGGQESWIIAGMEWAARDQHAKVISMSLGGSPTDGTDPMSQALNTLSAETGALFTVAAGNAGPGFYTVGSPGAADAALTVGAVDGADNLADFSSWGPRLGDGGLKPEITAPGVAILAARSQYAAEGSGYYQELSGTSMATPHVAGAAVLLAAQHPDWSGQQLKDALVSNAKPTPQYLPYKAGNGRLDIAATSKSPLSATASAYSGYHTWPVPAGEKVVKEITYTNGGDTDATLDLSTQVDEAPAGLFTLSASTVTVPAHGTASVTLTAAVDLLPVDKQLSGRLVAVDAANHRQLGTLIGIGGEGERHVLTLNAKDRSGRPLAGDAILIGRGSYGQFTVGEEGVQLRLPAGDYTTWLTADVEGTHGPSSKGLAVLSLVDIHLDQDRTATYDARQARQLKSTAPQATTLGEVRVNTYRDFGRDFSVGSSRWPDPSYDSAWVLPTQKVTDGAFVAGARWRLEQPALTLGSYDDVRVRRAATPLPKGRQDLEAVYAGDGSAAAARGVDRRGKAVVVRRSDAVSLQDQAAAASEAGAKLLVVVNDGVGKLDPWVDSIWAPAPPPLTIATLTRDEGERLITALQQGRQHTLTADSNPVTAYQYDLSHFADHVPADPTYRPGPGALARLDVAYRNFRPGDGVENRYDVWNGDWESSMNSWGMPVAGTRTDWVTAGVQYQASAQILREIQQVEPGWTSYRTGSRTPIQWFGPIQRPWLAKGYSPVRTGDQLTAVSPGWGTGPVIGTAQGNWDLTQQLSLYQGDQLVKQEQRDQLTATGLSPDRLPYRLVAENTRGAYPNPFSTSTRTEWGFTSTASDEAISESLIQLHYAVDVDADGRAGRTAELGVMPRWSETSSALGIRRPTVDVSYDDGKTWRHAEVRRTAASWSIRLDAPRTAQFVTLRTRADDGAGRTVDQEIVRAFGLR